ncbi:hypothetical protein EV421DRAFT_2064960 [Armillaria borealis]|uniref:Aminoglycoside phosphotransferase domain-containing protein n=1 Tax=Armillaria borealis TaxID=47425 RepID=A0AA39IYA2_9AGAR|nr:hypothetical protein EV421DRAFT_2064960 [Armillaria borealis]
MQFQANSSSAFEPLSATIVKRFEPFTSAVVLLVRRPFDTQPFILKLADRRLGYRHCWDVDIPWTSTVEGHLRRAVHDVQLGKKRNWFEIVHDTGHPQRPPKDEWEDWMWEVSTWTRKMNDHDTEHSAYRLLHRLQGTCIPRLHGVVRLSITSDSEPLHPITDIVQGLAFEYVHGVNMEDLKPGVDISQQEAEAISSRVMDVFRTIEAENCVIHNDLHIGNVILRDSPVIIDFGFAIIRRPGWSDEEWKGVVEGGPDTRNMRRALVNGGWKKNVTPFEMLDSRYDNPAVFNKYVENLPEDYRMKMFERVLDTDWDGAKEMVHRWRIKPDVRCRPWYD